MQTSALPALLCAFTAWPRALAGKVSMLQLAYCEGAAPLSVIAAADLAGVELAAKANPKFAKGSQPVLSLPDRYTASLVAFAASNTSV